MYFAHLNETILELRRMGHFEKRMKYENIIKYGFNAIKVNYCALLCGKTQLCTKRIIDFNISLETSFSTHHGMGILLLSLFSAYLSFLNII